MKIIGLIIFFTSISLVASAGDPKCGSAVCPKGLDCQYPKVTVELPDPHNECCNITECICEGTSHRLSSSHSPDAQFKSAQRYTNCTMIDGNLEIVYLHSSEQEVLEATKHIKVVKGYVLIALNFIHYIDLSSLRLIRGEELYHASRTKSQTCNQQVEDHSRGYALYVTTNYRKEPSYGLKGIKMQSLTEIMKGDVKIDDNRDLCFLDTIIWNNEIFNSPKQRANVTLSSNATNYCPPCPSDCSREIDNELHCWGNEPGQCQQFTRLPCLNACSGRCNSEKQCCDSYCAAGCTVGDYAKGIKRQCHACKELNDFGKCVPQCPSRASGDSENPLVDESNIRYELTWYCVPECPSTRRLFENKMCVLVCPRHYYDMDGVCKKCPPGGCTNICRGLQVPGDLLYDDYIHAGNIGNFSKNCTIIEGSLNFRQSTFDGAYLVANGNDPEDGDSHCYIPPISENAAEALSVFENVEEITGFLGFEYWPFEDLCLFKNLKTIRGNQLRDMTYSLMVLTDGTSLRELCFNSLEEIQTGGITIARNGYLCHVSGVRWQALHHTPQPGIDFIHGNNDNCCGVMMQSNRALCHTKAMKRPQLYGNRSDYIVSVKRNAKEKKCAPCNPKCNVKDGCWGPDSDQCVTCLDFTDFTDAGGKFTERWLVDPKTKLPVPGHNTTTCVTECDASKGVYATADKKCFPCDPQCSLMCTGPGPTNCSPGEASSLVHGCKNVYFNGTCVDECPITHYQNVSRVCFPCGAGCIGGCDGPEDSYGGNGCKVCHLSYDTEENEYVYRGAQCQVCVDHLKDDECPLGCMYNNNTGTHRCYAPPSYAHIVAIIIVFVVIVFISTIGLIVWKCRKTIRTMRKHIGDKIVGDAAQPDDFDAPVTPSGTAPNRAQLRIVKENELAMGKTLGSGAFGAVYKAIWTSMHIEGQTIKIPVAVKKLKTLTHTNEIMDEAYVMASVDNPYLIRLLGICMTEQVSLITQLMPLGSLLEYVRDNSDNIGSRHMLTWCIQITKGMQYLEDMHLVHRDLAARNVLVKTPHHVKITDFGLAKMLNADESVYFAEGGKLPIKWLAIECITERKFSHLSDVWAFGVTCWEIFTFGARPYEGVRAVDVLALLERGERLIQPPICTIDVYMILIKCWMVDPLSRPKFSELVHEFSKMFHDHSRYIVIKGDPNPGMLSPNPEEERRFFERLIQEDGDGDLMVDEPDEYLLPRIGNQDLMASAYTQMSPTVSTTSDSVHPDFHEYQNQSVIDRQRGTSLTNGASTSHATNGAAPRGTRLFSRNTPSAHPASSSCNSQGGGPQGEGSGPPRVSDSSNPDDVFSTSAHGLHEAVGHTKSLTVDLPDVEKGEGGSVRYRPNQGNLRKDSEENPRYTEDPTSHRSSYLEPFSPSALQTSDQMLYDEDQYLLPTPNMKKPDYFDPAAPRRAEGETMPKVHRIEPAHRPGSIANSTYVESGQPSPVRSVRTDKTKNPSGERSAGPEYVNTDQAYPEYMNCGPEQDDLANGVFSKQNDGSPDKTDTSRLLGPKGQDVHDGIFYSNEEYMATDSGIGEDNHSVLSGSNTGNRKASGSKHSGSSQKQQNCSLSSGSGSNGSLGPLLGESPLRRRRLSSDEQQIDIEPTAVAYKPVPKPRPGAKKSQKSTSSNVSVGLDNPEYMMLQESMSATAATQPFLPDT